MPAPAPGHSSARGSPSLRRLLLLLALSLVGALVHAPARSEAPARSSFDHLTTGFELLGQHRDLQCESCHVNAIFKGTPKSCSACHGVGTTVRATAKPASHIMSTDQCDGCHTEVAWKPAVNFDHKQALGSCSSCHNNVQAQGKPPNHIVTDLECDACHTTVSWTGATFTHLGVTGGCAECHNNVSAQGMPGNHMPIGTPATPCEACHSNTNFSNWLGGKINHPAVTGMACASCHETASYLGMHPSTNTSAADSRPNATLDPNHPKTGDCGQCHDTSSFSASLKPANHIPTNAPCAQCHTTPGNNVLYSVVGVHQGVTSCLSCHGPGTGPFANVTIVGWPGSPPHIPIGSLDCNGSGCHTTANVTPGGFRIGAGSSGNLTNPTLSVAGHQTVASAVGACSSCHETAPYSGMIASSSAAWGDSRPTAYDSKHPLPPADCGTCHTTTPTFGSNQRSTALPTGHIPIAPPTYGAQPACPTCHTTAGNFTQFSVSAVHQGVSGCAVCHGSSVNTTFLNVTPLTTPANHIPIGTGATAVDCNGSGCHAANGGAAGGFRLGAASPTAPSLSVQGHTTVAAGVAGCIACHENAAYLGMSPSTTGSWGDSRPTAFDALHPTQGECNTCHTTAPTFATNETGGSLPAGHVPIAPPVYAAQPACTTCHTTPSNYGQYAVSAVHQGVTTCNACHASNVNTTFKNVTMVTTPATHIQIGAPGALDCNGSGCHVTNGGATGGFKIGVGSGGSPSNPTLTATGHVTVAAVVTGCNACHESAPYMGMVPSTAAPGADSRPNSYLPSHPAAPQDCGTCHVTTPTFAANLLPNAPKPSNHIPTTAVCAQCHTTPGNFAVYSVSGVHQGVTTCAQCHGPGTGPFAGPPPSNTISIVGLAANHIPIGTADCASSGCHTTVNVNPGGFAIGAGSAGSPSNPTLGTAGHATLNAAGITTCAQPCHESAPYIGMAASTATNWGDSRPPTTASYDKTPHPTAAQGPECSSCHTTTPTFATNQTGSAKPSNHIPTGTPPYSSAPACATCHTTAGNNALYSVAAVHTGVTTCLACHAPGVASTFANVNIVTTPAKHIPINSLDCNGSGCHVANGGATGGFKIGAGSGGSPSSPTLNTAGHATINAAGITTCAQPCHESAPYMGMAASTASAWNDSRPPTTATYDKNPHPTTGDCGGCHTTSPTFYSNQTGGSKPANHIPTSAACTQCHTTAGNYAAYVMGATGHTGITSNCAQCHAYGLSFYNMAPPTLVEPPSGATGHIPAVPPNGTGAIACELCHSPTQFTTFSGTVMKHAYVTSMKCDSCHEYGMKWKVNSGVHLWTRPQPSHHAGQDCGGSGCHSSRDKYVVRAPLSRQTTPTSTAPARATAALSGTRAVATSASGSGGRGQPAGHIATTEACYACHTPLAWLPLVRVDHTQVLGACASCHNGSIATGKGSRHLPASSACDTCHTTNAWTPARFDHAAVTPHSCTSCHNAVRAIGMPRTHIPTAQPCDSCHGTLAWSPVKVDHARLSASCATCHNNVGAVGFSPGHLRTQLDCARCHAYPDWSVVSFRHTSSRYPGGHAKLSCVGCHTAGTEEPPYTSATGAGRCAGCHAKDFKPAAHPRTAKGVSYSAQELADCAGACHIYSDTTQSTVIRSLPGPHHRATDATLKR